MIIKSQLQNIFKSRFILKNGSQFFSNALSTTIDKPPPQTLYYCWILLSMLCYNPIWFTIFSPLLTLDRISILTTLIIGQQTTIENKFLVIRKFESSKVDLSLVDSIYVAPTLPIEGVCPMSAMCILTRLVTFNYIIFFFFK